MKYFLSNRFEITKYNANFKVPNCSTSSTSNLWILGVFFCAFLVYYLCLQLPVATVFYTCILHYIPIECIILTVMALCLPIVYSYPTSLQCCLVFYTRLLYCVYLAFTTKVSSCVAQSALPTQPACAITSLFCFTTYSCIPCLVYMPIQPVMLKQPSEFPIALYGNLVSFSNIRLILPNGTYDIKSQYQAM